MKAKKLFSYKKSKITEEIALKMAQYCYRKTVIEDYHTAGKISEAEMMALNKEVVNKIYTFLEIISNPSLERERDIAFRGLQPMLDMPLNWDTPVFDPGLQKAIENTARLELFRKGKRADRDEKFIWNM